MSVPLNHFILFLEDVRPNLQKMNSHTYFSSDSSSSDSESDSSSSSSSSSDSESESDNDYTTTTTTTTTDDFDELEELLIHRADELAIARSLGVTYRLLEAIAENKLAGSKKMGVVVNRIGKKMNIEAVHQKVAEVRLFVRNLLAQPRSSRTSKVTNENGDEYSVTTDDQGRRQISRVESLERELAELKAMMANLAGANGVPLSAAHSNTSNTSNTSSSSSTASTKHSDTVSLLPSSSSTATVSFTTSSTSNSLPQSRRPPAFLSQISNGKTLRRAKSAASSSSNTTTRRNSKNSASDLMTQITRGAHLKPLEGGCSPGGTPAMVKSKRRQKKFQPAAGIAGALSAALDNKYKNVNASSSSSSDDDWSSGDDDHDAVTTTRIVRVAARRNTLANSKPKPIDIINTIISPLSSGLQKSSLNSSKSSTRSSKSNRSSKSSRSSRSSKSSRSSRSSLSKRKDRSQKTNQPPCGWGMGQTATTSNSMVTSTSSLSLASGTKAKRKLKMNSLLGSITNFDKSKMTDGGNVIENPELCETKTPTPTSKSKSSKGSGLLGGIAGFNKTALKSSKVKRSRRATTTSVEYKNPHSPAMSNGGGGLLGAISNFKSGSLRKTSKTSQRRNSTNTSNQVQVETKVDKSLFSMIQNKKLRKVTKRMDKIKQTDGVENSPSFLRIKLRKTGRR